MRKTRREVYEQELIVIALRWDDSCSADRFIKQVMKLIRLSRKDCSCNHGDKSEDSETN